MGEILSLQSAPLSPHWETSYDKTVPETKKENKGDKVEIGSQGPRFVKSGASGPFAGADVS